MKEGICCIFLLAVCLFLSGSFVLADSSGTLPYRHRFSSPFAEDHYYYPTPEEGTGYAGDPLFELPPDTLKSMSTAGLYEACLNYPIGELPPRYGALWSEVRKCEDSPQEGMNLLSYFLGISPEKRDTPFWAGSLKEYWSNPSLGENGQSKATTDLSSFIRTLFLMTDDIERTVLCPLDQMTAHELRVLIRVSLYALEYDLNKFGMNQIGPAITRTLCRLNPQFREAVFAHELFLSYYTYPQGFSDEEADVFFSMLDEAILKELAILAEEEAATPGEVRAIGPILVGGALALLVWGLFRRRGAIVQKGE